jgi:hypothetical protein
MQKSFLVYFFKFLIIFLGSSFLIACSYNKLELPEPTPLEEPETIITYNSFTKRMIDNNHCLECHSGPTPAAGRDYSTYSGIKDVAQNGLLKLRAIDGQSPSMPLGYPELDQSIKDTLTLWINQGAQQ